MDSVQCMSTVWGMHSNLSGLARMIATEQVVGQQGGCHRITNEILAVAGVL